jgi:predicted aminopeptidase
MLRGTLVRAVALLGCAVLGLLVTGCFSVNYLVQAGHGQREITLYARDNDEVLLDPGVSPRTKYLLSHVGPAKAFGERHGLRPTKNYRRYVDLRRRYVVWVVSAAQPLELRSTSWHFPIVGAVPYLGWFHEKDARAHARTLEAQGLDVDVRGSRAYSTLGWFQDPVLSTMITDGDDAVGELVNTVLHESVHATLYLKSQTALNESLASFVADRLTPIYLEEHTAPGAKEKEAYLAAERMRKTRTERLHRAYEDLSRLYGSDAPREEKLARKAEYLAALRAELGFSRELSNATLAQFKSYHAGAPELDALLEACEGSFPRFLGAVRKLDRSSGPGARGSDLGAWVKPLVDARCPG